MGLMNYVQFALLIAMILIGLVWLGRWRGWPRKRLLWLAAAGFVLCGFVVYGSVYGILHPDDPFVKKLG